MPSPFPGMDPWLEHPGLWPDVHERLVIAIAAYLGPILRPHYYVAVGIHSYVVTLPLEPLAIRYPDVMLVSTLREAAVTAPATTAVARPDAPSRADLSKTSDSPEQAREGASPVEVRVPVPEPVEESYLEVRDVATGKVIAVIEVLSPTHKRPGQGREAYETKRLAILRSRTHLIEIDLLRDWEPMPFWGDGRDSHYRVLVRRGERRERADLYAFTVRDPIPRFPLPLQEGDAEPVVDLKSLLDGVYDRAGYDLRVDYTKPPVPPLSEADAQWAAQVLLQARP